MVSAGSPVSSSRPESFARAHAILKSFGVIGTGIIESPYRISQIIVAPGAVAGPMPVRVPYRDPVSKFAAIDC
jgi:hypothetical protein